MFSPCTNAEVVYIHEMQFYSSIIIYFECVCVWRVRINEYRFYSEKLEHLVLCAHTHKHLHIYTHRQTDTQETHVCSLA